MATFATFAKRSSKRTYSVGQTVARLVGPIGFTAMTLLGGMVVSQPADAASKVCGERSKILAQLEQKHEETPRALGLSADGGVLEVLVSPEGGWTMLVTYPSKPTCVIAVGEAWQMLQLTGGQPA
jgi:hypothetical protein